MDDFLSKIRMLVQAGQVRFSDHGYEELAKDEILARDVVGSLDNAMIIEEYPNFYKGPCALFLQMDEQGSPIHVVWGIPRGMSTPAVVVTAYRPDTEKWTNDWMRRTK